jgi:hypothetical protein
MRDSIPVAMIIGLTAMARVASWQRGRFRSVDAFVPATPDTACVATWNLSAEPA